MNRLIHKWVNAKGSKEDTVNEQHLGLPSESRDTTRPKVSSFVWTDECEWKVVEGWTETGRSTLLLLSHYASNHVVYLFPRITN
jgi:hypothetical protein